MVTVAAASIASAAKAAAAAAAVPEQAAACDQLEPTHSAEVTEAWVLLLALGARDAAAQQLVDLRMELYAVLEARFRQREFNFDIMALGESVGVCPQGPAI
jgi:hypothetical protein